MDRNQIPSADEELMKVFQRSAPYALYTVLQVLPGPRSPGQSAIAWDHDDPDTLVIRDLKELNRLLGKGKHAVATLELCGFGVAREGAVAVASHGTIRSASAIDEWLAAWAEAECGRFFAGDSFLARLYRALQEPANDSIIGWNEEGTTIQVHNASALKLILQNNYIPSSFSRNNFTMRTYGRLFAYNPLITRQSPALNWFIVHEQRYRESTQKTKPQSSQVGPEIADTKQRVKTLTKSEMAFRKVEGQVSQNTRVFRQKLNIFKMLNPKMQKDLSKLTQLCNEIIQYNNEKITPFSKDLLSTRYP